jgi:hypothetical protein
VTMGHALRRGGGVAGRSSPVDLAVTEGCEKGVASTLREDGGGVVVVVGAGCQTSLLLTVGAKALTGREGSEGWEGDDISDCV